MSTDNRSEVIEALVHGATTGMLFVCERTGASANEVASAVMTLAMRTLMVAEDRGSTEAFRGPIEDMWAKLPPAKACA